MATFFSPNLVSSSASGVVGSFFPMSLPRLFHVEEKMKKKLEIIFADKASLMKKYNADKIIFLMSCSNKLTFFYIFFAESVDCSLLRLWLMYCHFHSSVKAMMEGAPPDADFILPASPHPRWKQMAAGLQHWHSYTTSWYLPGSAIFP